MLILLMLKGAVAQLGERYNGIVEVVGSIPIGSTNIELNRQRCRLFLFCLNIVDVQF